MGNRARRDKLADKTGCENSERHARQDGEKTLDRHDRALFHNMRLAACRHNGKAQRNQKQNDGGEIEHQDFLSFSMLIGILVANQAARNGSGKQAI